MIKNDKVRNDFLKLIDKAAVIGGDRRNEIFAELVARCGIETALFGFESSRSKTGATKCVSVSDALRQTGLLLLPVPLFREKGVLYAPCHEGKILLDEVLSQASPGCVIVSAGTLHTDGDFELINLSEYEPFLLKNALLTCEGAIKVAIEHCEKSIYFCKILVTGYGRIGKILARQLKALGADVTVSARKASDFAYASVCGIKCIHTDNIAKNGSYDIIFNTVPTLILDEKTLSALEGNAMIIELASKPYGVDLESARSLGIKTVVAGGLPGKTSPYSAGNVIFESTIQILNEKGYKLCSASV